MWREHRNLPIVLGQTAEEAQRVWRRAEESLSCPGNRLQGCRLLRHGKQGFWLSEAIGEVGHLDQDILGVQVEIPVEAKSELLDFQRLLAQRLPSTAGAGAVPSRHVVVAVATVGKMDRRRAPRSRRHLA